MRRILVAFLATTALLLSGPPTYAHAAAAPGAPGVGDAYYPNYGNGGYDVRHYDVRLRYFPETDRLQGTTTILARATTDLTRFNLDFLLEARSVRVNGWAATFAREGVQELVVTPARELRAGQPMTIVVQYDGVPSSVSAYGITAWERTADGAMAIGEPEIAAWWFPANDHPTDKATFDISVAVPDGVEVISNGVMPRPPLRELLGWTRWSWRSTQPMAPYLAFVAIGQYDIVTDTAPNGQPVINAYSQRLPTELAGAARASIERTPEVVEWASGVFGPYPFEAQGGVVGPPDGITFALENQTRPVYSPGFFRRGSNVYVVVHEQAHQWFGDSVAVARWQDIWLNEGFASYAEWLWSADHGEGTAQELFDFTYALYPADDPFWTVQPGDPGPERLFDGAVYDRGAMTLHQLRLAVGDEAFFTIVRRWAAEHRHGNGTTAQFIALAEDVSGQELDALFTAWLFTAARPEPIAVPGAARSAAPRQPTSWPAIRQTRELLRH
ncbi:MAG TPA: M1 family metallopeptidase [Catenuloplanes sp.]